jgi:hypothetical protein
MRNGAGAYAYHGQVRRQLFTRSSTVRPRYTHVSTLLFREPPWIERRCCPRVGAYSAGYTTWAGEYSAGQMVTGLYTYSGTRLEGMQGHGLIGSADQVVTGWYSGTREEEMQCQSLMSWYLDRHVRRVCGAVVGPIGWMWRGGMDGRVAPGFDRQTAESFMSV